MPETIAMMMHQYGYAEIGFGCYELVRRFCGSRLAEPQNQGY
jgi:hypothetical protein